MLHREKIFGARKIPVVESFSLLRFLHTQNFLLFPVTGEGLETDRNNMDCSRDTNKFIFKSSCFHKLFVRTVNFDVITSSALRE